MGRYFDTSSAAATLATSATAPTGSLDLSQQSQQSRTKLTDENIIDLRHAFEERAAIMEFDGGLSQEDAERCAASDMASQYEMSVKEINRLTRLSHNGNRNGRA